MKTISNLKKIMNEIIPADDYQHRNGFSNHRIIDKLNLDEKSYIEDELIRKLDDIYDSLIVETLAYMKSIKALPLLYNFLNCDSNALSKIILATSIFEINNDMKMINIAIWNFKCLQNIYQQISAFYYLNKFKNEKTNDIINEFIDSSNELIAFNAKRALEISKLV